MPRAPLISVNNHHQSKPIHTSPAPVARARILMTTKIPNQTDFDFASKKCASTVLMHVRVYCTCTSTVSPIHWRVYFGIIFAPLCFGKKLREAKECRNHCSYYYSQGDRALHCRFFLPSRCLFALPLLVWIE